MLTAAGKGKPQLKCLLFAETMPMRSNQGIVEELTRVMAYLVGADDPACQNDACSLFTVPLSLAGSQYVQRGKTAPACSLRQSRRPGRKGGSRWFRPRNARRLGRAVP